MKIKIYKNNNKLELVREIETDKTWVADRLPSGSSEIGDPNLTDFFESCIPPHTGSVVSGSILQKIDDDGNIMYRYFEGEAYTIEE